jgi:hypothetical protein
MLERLRATLSTLTSRQRYVAIGAIGALAIAAVIATFLVVGKRGCGSRDDVVARVADVSSRLQQAATQGQIKVEELASGIKRLNEASTRYEADKDHQAYCDALQGIDADFTLAD